jgi:hypothetical protein
LPNEASITSSAAAAGRPRSLAAKAPSMSPAIRPLLCAFCIEVMRDRKTNQRIHTLTRRLTVGTHMTAAKSAPALSMFQASAPAV